MPQLKLPHPPGMAAADDDNAVLAYYIRETEGNMKSFLEDAAIFEVPISLEEHQSQPKNAKEHITAAQNACNDSSEWLAQVFSMQRGKNGEPLLFYLGHRWKQSSVSKNLLTSLTFSYLIWPG